MTLRYNVAMIEPQIQEVIELDVRRLLCPMPVIRLQNKVKLLAKNSQVRVLCTDPGTRHDIPTWCRLYGHQVLAIEQHGYEIHFLVEVN